MTLHRRDRKVGDILVIEFLTNFDMVDKITKTCAEDNTNPRCLTYFLENKIRSLADLLQHIFFHCI